MDKFPAGSRIRVDRTAGPRLAGKIGSVIGLGYHPKSRRIVLDGSRFRITLHITYLAIVDEALDSSVNDQTRTDPVRQGQRQMGIGLPPTNR